MKSNVAKFFAWFLGIIYVGATIIFGTIQWTEIKNLHNEVYSLRYSVNNISLDKTTDWTLPTIKNDVESTLTILSVMATAIDEMRVNINDIGWNVSSIKRDISWMKLMK